jgi:cytochrome b561
MKERDYTIVFRIIHWAIAICIILMLITIFLRLNWMNKNHVSQIIQSYISTIGVSLTQDQSIALAKQIRKPMWEWHIYIGYVLTGLFAIRLLLPLIGSMKFVNPFQKLFSAKEKFQFTVYLIFYAFLATSLVTGLLIVNGPESIKESVEDIHVLSIYYLITYLILHFGGVIMAEFTNQQGIISRMVSGNRKIT